MNDPTSARRISPMFPLGSVVLPGAMLPLQVFEPRYLEMIRDCIDTGSGFGSVLIRRGSEVGGGDDRTDVGTAMVIVETQQFPDGRLGVLCIATERLRVLEWCADDPHPRAVVESWPTVAPTSDGIERAASALQEFLDEAIDLGYLPDTTSLDLSADPLVRSWQLCDASPMGAADRWDLLAEPDADRRMERFVSMMGEQLELLRFRGPRAV